MSLHWYAYISMNTYCYEIYHILLGIVWWACSNASSIMWIHPAVHKILANKTFTITDDLISQLFVIAFIHSTYVQIAFIWGFLAQLGLWKLVYWLWRYKLNEVCNSRIIQMVVLSSSQTVDLVFFYFLCVLFSYFSIFRTTRVRVRSDWSHCHISHNLMVWSQYWSWDLREWSRRF